MRSHAAPKLRTDRPSGGPSLVRIVAQHAHQCWVAAMVQALDRIELAANEERFEDHVVPSILIELFHWIGVAVCDSLEDRLHCTARALAGSRNMQLRMRIKGQTAVEGD